LLFYKESIMKKVAILLADGFEEVEAVTVVDFLRRAGVKVIVTSIGDLTVTGSNKIVIKADVTLASLAEELDGVVVPGGMPGSSNLAQSEKVIELIGSMNENNKLVAAICAAPALVLGGSGLLNGRKFTCYPGFEDGVTDGVFCTERVVHDANLITSRGPGTAAEFSIALIEYLLGEEAAKAVKEGTLQNW
jgi:4-methyl-5(b-hydroxyethyl)-thiazole monophosphate biosynthesis